MNKKVLFISYFFPPLGGGGVIRVTKFIKFLPKFGWQPFVLTPQKGFYKFKDKSLLLEIPQEVKITRIKYFEPAFWFKSFYWQSFLAYWLYPLFLIPDRQILWLLGAVRSGLKIIKKEKINVIFTSSAPASDHLIGWILKKITGVRWVADFRDEWTTNPFKKFPTPLHRYFEKILEKKVVSAADQIITVSHPIARDLKNFSCQDKFLTITNGFDEEDFPKTEPHLKKYFKIIYVGSLYSLKEKNILLEAFKELNLKNAKIDFIGLDRRLSHREAVKKMLEADILLLILGPIKRPAVLTGKIFEYLAAKKPILALAPQDTQVSKLIKTLKVGEVVDPQNKMIIQEKILTFYQKWQKKELNVPKIDLEIFSRQKLTGDLANVFNKLQGKKEKIKLCLIGNIGSPQNQSLCLYFKKNGYEVHFITTKPGNIAGVQVHLLRNSRFTSWYFIKSLYQIRKIIRQIKPDIVHGQDLVFGGIWAYLSGFRPYVVTTWGSDVFKFEEFIAPEKYLIRKTLQKADLVTCSSKALANQAQKIGMPQDRWQLIHFGIDLNIFKKQKVFNRKKIIFCPRTIGPIYNTDILIQAFAQVVKSNRDVQLALVENTVSENYLLEIEKLIIKYGLIDRIIFWPKVSNEKIADYYNQAEVIVSLSSSDGCSVSFLEAMAMENKIVVTDLPYIKEWKNNKNFWTVPVRNIEATATALRLALKYSATNWQKIGQSNRQLIEKKAEIKSNFEKLDRLYRELI